jgi:hypothetical protein
VGATDASDGKHDSNAVGGQLLHHRGFRLGRGRQDDAIDAILQQALGCACRLVIDFETLWSWPTWST